MHKISSYSQVGAGFFHAGVWVIMNRYGVDMTPHISMLHLFLLVLVQLTAPESLTQLRYVSA